MVQKILPAEIITQNAAFAVVVFLGTGAMRISTTAPTAGRRWMEVAMESEKLVSADGLREWLKKIPLHDLSDGRGLCRIIFAEDFERAMASFPGDAIQIVRCRDCKWFADNNGGEWYGCKMFHVVRITPEDAPKPDDFCSYGERREE